MPNKHLSTEVSNHPLNVTGSTGDILGACANVV